MDKSLDQDKKISKKQGMLLHDWPKPLDDNLNCDNRYVNMVDRHNFCFVLPCFCFLPVHNGNCSVHPRCEESNCRLMNISGDLLSGDAAPVTSAFLLVYNALSISEFVV